MSVFLIKFPATTVRGKKPSTYDPISNIFIKKIEKCYSILNLFNSYALMLPAFTINKGLIPRLW